MANQWFFKWHHIGGKAVEIESFRDGPIRYGGIAFSGTAHKVYWDTIQHYLRQKVSSIFDDLEREIRDYPPDTRREALREATAIVAHFAGRIRQKAVETDRTLRGNGVTFPEPRDVGHTQYIQQRAHSLAAIYVPTTPAPLPASSRMTWVKAFHDKHHWWIYFILTVVGVVAAILAV
jgi:hypothetical protein